MREAKGKTAVEIRCFEVAAGSATSNTLPFLVVSEYGRGWFIMGACAKGAANDSTKIGEGQV